MSDDIEEPAEFGLVMPLIACTDQGGPYDGESFVAGTYLGEACYAARLCKFGVSWARYVPSALVPQLDLVAMNEGVTIRATVWDEHPDEWTLVEMQQGPFPDPEADR